MNIVTISDPISGNKGSSSMIYSIIQNLSKMYPDACFSIFTYYPQKDKKVIKNSPLCNKVEVFSATLINLLFHIVPGALLCFLLKKIGIKPSSRLWGKELNRIINADLYIGVGGATFNDSVVFKSIYHTLVLLPAKLLGIKLVVYTQTLGPFNSGFNRFCARMILPYADVIVGRGEITYKHLKKLSLTNITYATDGAFALQSQPDITEPIIEKYAPCFSGKKVVGISPNSEIIPFCRRIALDYAAAFGALVNYLVQHEYFPVLIPHSLHKKGIWSCHNEFLRFHGNDLPAIEEIIHYIDDPLSVMIIEEDYTYLELRALIGLLDYYVTSRFHGMVSALYMKRPVLVFGWYDHKYKEVMDEFGLSEFCFDYKEVTPQTVIGGFNNMVARRDEIIKKEEHNLSRVISESNKVYEIIKGVLENDPHIK